MFLEEAEKEMNEKLNDARLFDVMEEWTTRSRKEPISASLLTASEKTGPEHFIARGIKDEMKKTTL